MAYVEEAQPFHNVYANRILDISHLATSVVSFYFPVYVHLSFHLLQVPWCCAVDTSGPTALVLADVGHRLIILSYQCELPKLECAVPQRLLSIALQP